MMSRKECSKLSGVSYDNPGMPHRNHRRPASHDAGSCRKLGRAYGLATFAWDMAFIPRGEYHALRGDRTRTGRTGRGQTAHDAKPENANAIRCPDFDWRFVRSCGGRA